MDILKLLEKCELCPRKCGVNRLKGQTGYCGAGFDVMAARVMLHKWEEPCISCGNGSGAVFFSKCSMSCVYCQNYDISQGDIGKTISIDRLSNIFIELESNGANNINLVSPTHYVPQIITALDLAKQKGLDIPVIYNSNGYENAEVIKQLQGYIDIYLPDIKYFSSKYSCKYSNTSNYFEYTSKAVIEMYRQAGRPYLVNGILKKGLIIRHLLLPGLLSESKRILDWISLNFSNNVYISLMSQYVPMFKTALFPEINRKTESRTYEWLVNYALSIGLDRGFIQDTDSALDIYTPEFNLEGV